MPVEDTKGTLQGMVTSQIILKSMADKKGRAKNRTVADVMIEKYKTVAPNTSVKEAMDIMLKHKLGCLPVVQENELIGIITERQFLNITNRII